MLLGTVILFSFGFLAAIEAASVSGGQQRIVNGRDADIRDYPYQVSLRRFGRHFCGGSIISKRHVLTAAHCVDGVILTRAFDAITVNTGSSLSSGKDGRAYRLQDAVVHEEWTYDVEDSFKNDIALLTLTEDIKFNEKTMKIKLASRPAKLNDKAVITGWGVNLYGNRNPMLILQQADMSIIPRDECQAKHPLSKINENHVCAFQKYGVGACSGDSGGPLVVDNEVVGIASWVVPCAKGYPDVYTYVYNYVDWIHEKMNNL